MAFSIIAAVGKNRELGKKGGLIWHLPGDLAFFKKTTLGFPIFMGQNTFFSLPKVLPGRKHYVLTPASKDEFCQIDQARLDGVAVSVWPDTAGDVVLVNNLEDFVANPPEGEVFVIGGGMVYTQMVSHANKLYLTEIVAEDSDADTYFPEFDKEKYQRTELGKGEENGIKYTFVQYEK